MKLEGIHHITAITGDGQTNVDFYVGVLGLRLVKKTVNQDQTERLPPLLRRRGGRARAPTSPSSSSPARRPGRAGAGMVHRDRAGASHPTEALDFWAQRLARQGRRDAARGRQPDLRRPRGPRPRAARRRRPRRAADRRAPRGPGRARAAGLPRRPRLHRRPRGQPRLSRGGARVRARRRRHLGGARRRPRRPLRSPTSRRAERGLQGAGSVHHIAWASHTDEHEAWRERAIDAGARPTPVIDRFYFRSIYFREPSGVLFEIATLEARASRSTRTPSTSARSSRCRRSSSTCATRSSPTSRRFATRATRSAS